MNYFKLKRFFKATEETAAATPEVSNETSQTPTAPIFQYDEYWLKRGKDFADNTLDSLSLRMQSYINFLNLMASGAFFGGVALLTFLKTTNIIVYLCFIIPILVIFWSKYKIAIEINRAEYFHPDLRSPLQINKAFNSIVDGRREQLRLAGKPVLTSVIVFIIFIPFGFYYNNVVEVRNNKESLTALQITNHDSLVEASGMATDTLVSVMFAGIKEKNIIQKSNILDQNVRDNVVFQESQDTVVNFKSRISKDKYFTLFYALDNFNFQVTSIKLQMKDGEILRAIEKDLKN